MNFNGNRIGPALNGNCDGLARHAVAGRIAEQVRKDLLQSSLVKRADQLARSLEHKLLRRIGGAGLVHDGLANPVHVNHMAFE